MCVRIFRWQMRKDTYACKCNLSQTSATFGGCATKIGPNHGMIYCKGIHRSVAFHMSSPHFGSGSDFFFSFLLSVVFSLFAGEG
jgi:hypothetical protein